MSDSTSFTFSLPKESSYYFNLNLKMSAILLIILLLCIFMSSIMPIMIPGPRRRCYMEPYSNIDMSTYKSIKYTSYSRTALTAPDTEVNSPSNLTFGSATRMISSKINNNKDMYYNLNIDANLYVLGGNIYETNGQMKIDQEYIVELINPKLNKILNMGALYKDNDGLYKLRYSIDISKLLPIVGTMDDLLNYNIVRIKHNIKNPQTNNMISSNILIQGDLNKLQ
jgi:hypothetical protein